MKTIQFQFIGLISGLLLLMPHALADSIVELGIHFGGDEVVQEPYTNGQIDSIKAGELFSFDVGRLLSHSPNWESQITFGIKSDAKYDRDVEISWVRYPLNGIIFYRMQYMRVGVGATIHFSPKLQGGGHAGNVSEEYKNAPGGLLELDVIYNEKFLWGVRLTFIEYESTKTGRVIDGSSIGFLIIGQL
ncbi:MAG: hypothetical protein OEY52_01820 [Gammaproteobacteria bacterium]|nr:hypothetical protein [Gammaproteobacteria bacterium]